MGKVKKHSQNLEKNHSAVDWGKTTAKTCFFRLEITIPYLF